MLTANAARTTLTRDRLVERALFFAVFDVSFVCRLLFVVFVHFDEISRVAECNF